MGSLNTPSSVLSAHVRNGQGLRAKTVSVTISSLTAAGLLGVAALVIARTLGPDGRGVFAASYSLVFVLMLVGSVGIGLGGRRLLALGPESGGATLPEYASAARTLVVAQIAIAAFGAVVLLPIFEAGRDTAEQVAFVACCVGSLASLLSREALFGVGEGGAAALILAIGCGATLVGVGAVAATGLSSVSWFLWMYALAGFGEAAACSALAVARTRHARTRPRRGMRRAVLFSGRAVLVQLLAQAAATRGDRLVIGAVAGATDLGLYAVAVSVMELLSMGAYALGNVAFQGVASGSLPIEAMRRARRVTMVGTAVAAVVLIVLAPWLIRFAFGSRFDDAVPALRILAIAAIAYGSFQIDTQQLIASARSSAAAALGVGAATAMIVGDLVVVPRWGIEGAAWVSVVVYVGFAFGSRATVDARLRR